MVSFNDFPVTLTDFTPGLSNFRTSIDGHPTGFYGIICTCTLIMYMYIYTLYGIQDPGPWIHVTVHTDPYPVPHETTNTIEI